MKKLSFLVLVAATMLFASCGDKANKAQTEGAEPEKTEEVASSDDFTIPTEGTAVEKTIAMLETSLKFVKNPDPAKAAAYQKFAAECQKMMTSADYVKEAAKATPEQQKKIMELSKQIQEEAMKTAQKMQK